MAQIVVGIGEYKVSDKPDDVIKTFALGSCIAVVMYDKVKSIAGMIHIALPDSNISNEKRYKLPGYFADTGLPLIIDEMKNKGAILTNVKIKMIGGANVLDTNYHFDIGARNALAVKKILWKHNLGIIAEDIGGKIARTCWINVNTGEIIISSKNKNWSI